MKNFAMPYRKGNRERGYALLLVVFLTTVLLLTVMVAAPSVRTERQREREEDMIWRGKQYIRGIKLFYRKNGRFPTTLDDLTKPKVGSLRFMRQAYKDPMNKEDGSWRLIYVGPSGQLIGSLKPQQTFQLPGLNAAPAGVPPAPGAQQGSFGSSGFGSSSFGSSGLGQSANKQPGAPGTPQQTGTPPNAPGANPNIADDGSNPPASATSSSNPIIGGNIIGVGSKINKRSVILYDKAKNYRLFEFVWNPSKDLMNAIGQGAPRVGTPNSPGTQSGFGQSGFGQSGFGQAPNGQSGTPQPPPTPPQQPQPQP